MKAGISIQDMSREILRQAQAKEDYLINTSHLQMEPWDNAPMLRVLDESGNDQVEPLMIRQTAHQQLGTYLNIPRKYYERMQSEDPDLLAYNVNSWLHKNPEQRMIRTIDGQARAFLSNRYRRIDNLDIAQMTIPIIGEIQDARYESCQITDDFMYIKVVNPRLTAEVVPGDIVQSGVVISNSETGLGAVSIQPLVYRLVCSNGMVVNAAGTRRTHIGRVNSTEENFALYSQKTIEADDRAFVLKIQDTVRAAVSEAQFAKVIDQMKEANDVKLDTSNIPGIIKMTSSSFGLSEDEGKGVLQHLIEDANYTLYGLSNAVTRYSQDVESYDRASKLEEIGYSVLTMSPALFHTINNAELRKAA